MKKWLASVLLCGFSSVVGISVHAAPMPHLEGARGHYVLNVDNKPFFVLAAQMHNSSAWPSMAPKFWDVATKMHVNTVEAPVYWETFEPTQNTYDYSETDRLIAEARTHHVRLVFLWFGTWKNGNGHYVPLWMKRDNATYPRLQNADGDMLDGFSPLGTKTLERDIKAFTALMKHLRDVDSDQHTVIMVQVENEPGLLGTVRDHGPKANEVFAGQVPAEVLRAMQKTTTGTWSEVFGADASELFSAWAVSHYINQVASAGAHVNPLPLYTNVWLRYRGLTQPGAEYPSGGATWNVLNVWKAETPSINVLGTDTYTDSLEEFHRGLLPYQRADNTPWLSESGITVAGSRWVYDLLSRGGIGASVFGVDDEGHDAALEEQGINNALLGPALPTLIPLAEKGAVAAFLESPGILSPEHNFGTWKVRGSFGGVWGYPDPTSVSPNTHGVGRALVAQMDDTHFLVAGSDTRISFLAPTGTHVVHEVERVEEGNYTASGQWKMTRLWNGDETDSGLNLPHQGVLLKVQTSH